MRPQKHIDWDIVQDMLEAQCLGTEIAAFFGMHPNTFYDRVLSEHGMSFTEFSTQKKDIGKSKMRQAQYKTALEGNTTAQVWWGKNYLGQRDQPMDKQEFNPTIGNVLDKLKIAEIPEDAA